MKDCPTILGLATAVPANRYEQMTLYEEFMAQIFSSHRAPAIFRASEIDSRYSVIADPTWLLPNPTAEARNDLYITEAPKLAAKVIEDVLARVKLTASELDELIVVSCTGIDTPGLDVLISEQMAMSSTLRRTAIIGMGCHGLLPGLRHAALAVKANPQSKVLVLTLELCTLHLQHESSIRNILGSALFGDGASAAIVGDISAKNGHTAPSLIDSMSYSDYQARRDMAFHPGDHGYRIHLSTRIPKLLRLKLPDLIDQFLRRNQLQSKDVAHWIVHPGGAKILDYVEQALELDQDELRHARAILREFGNMSSATLLFALERHQEQEKPRPNEYGILVGFGPGLTIELSLLRW